MHSVERLTELMAGGRVLALTGAGVSTDSGIPDYRDENGAWKRPQPIQFREFVGSEALRRRYWARSLVGWRHLAGSRPNAAHAALERLERGGTLAHIVTQNVDGLHQRAGSRHVIDLHGRLDRVVCLGCGAQRSRVEFQELLATLNPDFVELRAAPGADGDAQLEHGAFERFQVPACDCGGLWKPDVVFFGEGVPKGRVQAAMDALASSRALLVVGSSLMVFSGFRFAREAHRLGVPIAIVNRGKTRADDVAALRIEGNAGDVLSTVATALAEPERAVRA